MITYFIIGFIIGAILLCVITLLIAKSRYIVQQKKIDDSVYQELKQLQRVKKDIETDVQRLQESKQNNQQDLEFLQSQKQNLNLDIEKARQQAEEIANAFYKEKMEQAQERFGQELENLGLDFQKQKVDYINDFTEMQIEAAKEFQLSKEAAAARLKEYLASLRVNCDEAEKILQDIIQKTSVAVEANKRAELERTQKDFYRLVLSEDDLSDVMHLKEVEPYLKNKEVLAKLIWKTYYERAYTEMCNRVLGPNVRMGIYKITNLQNNMPYVGQSVDIRSRWRDHIKAGLGINSSNNRLYTSMRQAGPENFTFELLEECDRANLNEKERYWINFFHTEDFGLNSNKGVTK